MRPLGVASSEQDSYDELICQRTELLHQVYHLERSNYGATTTEPPEPRPCTAMAGCYDEVFMHV